MDISVTVTEKIAIAESNAEMVCGNRDYTITFTFDAEWDDYPTKTARFVYWLGGSAHHIDVIFAGNTVHVPVLKNVYEIAVGVYAGNLRTTTPARIPCTPSITCAEDVRENPQETRYEKLLAYLKTLEKPTRSRIASAYVRGSTLQSSHIGTGTQGAYILALSTPITASDGALLTTYTGEYMIYKE